MNIYAVIDTNVLVSALLSKKSDVATVIVLRAVFERKVTPLYHPDILTEYNEVMRRPQFHFQEEMIQTILAAFAQFGIEVTPHPSQEILPDPDDLIFYEIALEKHRSTPGVYLVTGNQKHYPARDFIVTPAKLVNILGC